MTDHFTTATAAARRCARKLLRQDVPPTIIADGLIDQALALWAADTGRAEDAARLLVAWVSVRDAR